MKMGLVAIVFAIAGYCVGLNSVYIKGLESERENMIVTSNDIIIRLETMRNELQEAEGAIALNNDLSEKNRVNEYLNVVEDYESNIDDHEVFDNDSVTEEKNISNRREKTKKEIILIQQGILDSALSPEVKIASVVSSSNMQSLSLEDQNKVMRELARRYDNGEIDQSQLIPQ